MNTIIRTGLVLIISTAGLSGCSSVRTAASTVTSSVEHAATRIFHPATPATPTAPAPAGLDDYKTQVARHVAEHNPDRVYAGTLPPMLPAVVVLEITVDRDGQLADVAVQRSRDPDASEIALASVRRSSPLPAPQQLARDTGRLTFSETFLFADSERYQLRSLARPQASE
ncbi:TonB C-terminal domain-containing protein [Massilia putida]|uniref:TonB C-terminal domain-containing protein n=1 Tax=Massilia putida TaxID=1141883 RepID=UPI0009521192|nr:TonB C-terminal domain-containing protein [Massilia putida]